MMTNYFPLVAAFFLLATLTAHAQHFRGRLVLGEEIARRRVEQAGLEKLPVSSTVVPDTATAFAIAEQVVFSKYGRKQIVAQRPYEAYLVDGYWCISGTLPWGYVGGTFTVILNAATYRVAKVYHQQ
ncbi:hypothetical protein E5K00_08045 [Hymenobacter aquaticus]|uniref:NTF2 fold domain-containing protein n=1 Tax=Hymenobacter aquaticus TaxID=1867101 RepID=A0A4Z0Q4Y1_9BACT|nr:NTF2 fold immunity protein [Hymenobacter aquaticus]TGE25138.1 hypothetical protein E5K00_08045 [Hymenobacter aquaticus]